MQEFKKTYEDGLNDFCNAMKKIVYLVCDGGMAVEDLRKIFGKYNISYIINNYSPQEIVNSINEYENKQIYTSDQVKSRKTGLHGAVMEKHSDTFRIWWADGTETEENSETIVRTGKKVSTSKILELIKDGYDIPPISN